VLNPFVKSHHNTMKPKQARSSTLGPSNHPSSMASSLLLQLLLLMLLVLLLGRHGGQAFAPPRYGGLQQQQQQQQQQRRRSLSRPMWAELTQVEVRQATQADFATIAQTRSAVLFVPERAPKAGGFQWGNTKFAVATEEERLVLSRVPFLVAGQAVAFLVEGRPAKGSNARVLAAAVDVFVRNKEGPSLPRRVFIKNMIVDPAYRRQGHARRLLARVERHALEVGAAEVHLEVLCKNDAAMALYESEGFELLREPFNLLARALSIGKVTMRKPVGEARGTARARGTGAAAVAGGGGANEGGGT
jgi:ribosomal protein S18 acetylase RimI-like enzyme